MGDDAAQFGAQQDGIGERRRCQTPREQTQVSILDVELEIVDRGEAMAPEFVDRLQIHSQPIDYSSFQLADLPEGGLGLHIMHAVMSHTTYARVDGMNRLSMTRYL